jgi:ribosome assembly protein YihI (activator of Der GTPase)
MGSRDAASESKGFARRERDPRMGSRDAASESKGFARRERDPRMGSRDAASESKGFAREERVSDHERLGARPRNGACDDA